MKQDIIYTIAIQLIIAVMCNKILYHVAQALQNGYCCHCCNFSGPDKATGLVRVSVCPDNNS